MNLIFKNAQEQKMYQKYKQLKGEQYHAYVAEQINCWEYSFVASAIQYDLKLKYILYRYVCFFEEYLRANLMNAQVKSIDYFLANKVSLSEGQQLYFKYQAEIKALNNDYIDLSISEFDAIRDLRNDISHFKPLIFEKHALSQNNMQVLLKALPHAYQANFKNEINTCAPDFELIQQLKIEI